jgi:hypothetical protein
MLKVRLFATAFNVIAAIVCVLAGDYVAAGVCTYFAVVV